MMTGVKRKGRPPKSVDGPATVSLAMRLRPEVYERIRKDAAASGRSISAQAEHQMLRPDTNDVARLIGAAISAVEDRSGARWDSSQSSKAQCRSAVDLVANILLGPLPDLRTMQFVLQMASSQFDEEEKERPRNLLLSGGIKSREELDDQLKYLEALLDAREVAISALERGQKA